MATVLPRPGAAVSKAPLAAATFRASLPMRPVNDAPPVTRVAAVVPFYAPHDLVVQAERRKALGGLAGLIGMEELNDESRKKLAEISPLNHIQGGLPPFLQIHGDKDVTVPLSQSVNFEAKTKAAGNSCETIVVPGGIHGMGGWEKLGSDYQKQLIEWLRKTLK